MRVCVKLFKINLTANITTFKDLNAKKYQKGMAYTCIMRKNFISKKNINKKTFSLFAFLVS